MSLPYTNVFSLQLFEFPLIYSAWVLQALFTYFDTVHVLDDFAESVP